MLRYGDRAHGGRPERPFRRSLVLGGLLIPGAFLAVLFGWFKFAPLAEVVVSPAVVSAGSDVSNIRSSEAGILREILVREGDQVGAGDVLLRVEGAAPAARLQELEAAFLSVLAEEARLTAERDDLPAIRFPAELTDAQDSAAAQAAIEGQRAILEANRDVLAEQRAIHTRARAALGRAAEGLRAQRDAARRARTGLDGDGEVDRLDAAITAVELGLADIDRQRTEQRARRAVEVQTAADQARARADAIRAELAALREGVKQTEIRSPVAGRVVTLKVPELGAAIAAGADLIGVMPSDAWPVVRAAIDPLDIDRVHAGMEATVYLASPSRRAGPGLPGQVTGFSTERLVDQHSGAPYYLARVELDPASVQALAVPLPFGTGAEVAIRAGDRTTWDNVTAPIADKLRGN